MFISKKEYRRLEEQVQLLQRQVNGLTFDLDRKAAKADLLVNIPRDATAPKLPPSVASMMSISMSGMESVNIRDAVELILDHFDMMYIPERSDGPRLEQYQFTKPPEEKTDG